MATGTVDFFNDTGGYGFIDTQDSGDDVFFHMGDVGGPDLEEGQEVEFEIVQEYMNLAESLLQGTDGTVVQSLKDRDIFDLLGFE